MPLLEAHHAVVFYSLASFLCGSVTLVRDAMAAVGKDAPRSQRRGRGAAFAENVVIESFTVPCTVHQVRAWTGSHCGVARPSRFLSFVWTISHDAPAIAGALWLTVT